MRFTLDDLAERGYTVSGSHATRGVPPSVTPITPPANNQVCPYRFSNEATFTSKVCAMFVEADWLAYHTYNSKRSGPGFPDLTLIHIQSGRLVFSELKMPGNKPTKEQVLWLDALSLNHEVYLWYPQDWDQINEVVSGRSVDRSLWWQPNPLPEPDNE